MVKNVCQTYLKGLKEFHFKLFLVLVLASGATRPRLGVSEHPLNPQFQGLKIDVCSYRCSNCFSRSAPACLKHFCACVGMCMCDCTPLLKRPVDAVNAQFVCLSFNLSMPKDNMFFGKMKKLWQTGIDLIFVLPGNEKRSPEIEVVVS